MPFVKVYIHFVWCTKKRIPYLKTRAIRESMWQHIKENSVAKGIFIDFVNGYSEHCHCLVSLGAEQTISKVMQLLKGESAFWFNKQNFINEKLEWQDARLNDEVGQEYFAVSVSESALNKVREYIKNQGEHHSKKTFQQEYDEFIEKYGFQKFKDGD